LSKLAKVYFLQKILSDTSESHNGGLFERALDKTMEDASHSCPFDPQPEN
jgi:hypothetical protein